jgi:hypothetical protein
MKHDEYVSQAITTTAQAILDGNLGLIEGSVAMHLWTDLLPYRPSSNR